MIRIRDKIPTENYDHEFHFGHENLEISSKKKIQVEIKVGDWVHDSRHQRRIVGCGYTRIHQSHPRDAD